MGLITPSAETYGTLIAAAAFSTSNTPGITVQLDLRQTKGAVLFCRIGRTVTTALTDTPRFTIRKSLFLTNAITAGGSSNARDFLGGTVAVNAPTVGTIAAGAASTTLSSATGFASMQSCCLSNGGSRIEFVDCGSLNGTTFYVGRNYGTGNAGFQIAHTSGDTITNGADIGEVALPGGYIWEVTPINNSGVTLIMAVDYEIAVSDTY